MAASCISHQSSRPWVFSHSLQLLLVVLRSFKTLEKISTIISDINIHLYPIQACRPGEWLRMCLGQALSANLGLHPGTLHSWQGEAMSLFQYCQNPPPPTEIVQNLGMFVTSYVFISFLFLFWVVSQRFIPFLVGPPPVEESAQIGDSAPHLEEWMSWCISYTPYKLKLK